LNTFFVIKRETKQITWKKLQLQSSGAKRPYLLRISNIFGRAKFQNRPAKLQIWRKMLGVLVTEKVDNIEYKNIKNLTSKNGLKVGN